MQRDFQRVELFSWLEGRGESRGFTRPLSNLTHTLKKGDKDMNDKNLEKGAPHRFKSGEKAVTSGRKGGVKSGEAKREKRLLSDICNMLGQMRSDSPLLEGLPDCDKTNDVAVAAAMYHAAQVGDTKAATWIRDTKGESKVQVDIAPAAPIDMSKLGFKE